MATSSPTHKAAWSHSLYWRSVVSFSACIAVALLVQAVAVQIWWKSAPDTAKVQAFTHAVADELGPVVAADPQLDVQRYIDEHYPRPLTTLWIIMARDAGAQVITRGPLVPSEPSLKIARDFYREKPVPDTLPDSWTSSTFLAAPILVNGVIVGNVSAVQAYSWLEFVGWKIWVLSAILLLLATTVAGRFVFGPVGSRLAGLEEVAERYGVGEFDARADERGADELAALAATFNRMAADLAARDAQLKAADRIRRLLLADVSHELMTPLTAIRAYREVLSMSDLAADPENSHSLGVIADETERLEQLVGDLLDLARLEAGGESLVTRDVSVENLVGRVAARHEPEAKLKGVSVTTAVGAGAEILYGDALRLEQALQNLATNALRHTPPGGEIEVRAELTGDAVTLSVRDTGGGIPPEHLPFVFDRFYKVDPSRTGNPAVRSGLGLSIVKAIVERHGGTVSATSEPGVATVFTIRLPAGAAAA